MWRSANYCLGMWKVTSLLCVDKRWPNMQVTPSFVWSNFYYPQISRPPTFELWIRCQKLGLYASIYGTSIVIILKIYANSGFVTWCNSGFVIVKFWLCYRVAQCLVFLGKNSEWSKKNCHHHVQTNSFGPINASSSLSLFLRLFLWNTVLLHVIILFGQKSGEALKLHKLFMISSPL